MFWSLNHSGSPPRMQGKEVQGLFQDLVGGITPAYAGKRGSGSLPRSCRRDHPRVCGEKISQTRRNLPLGGSPPRVRGKDQACSRWRYPDGITPACAGKSCPPQAPTFTRQDHPRVCGEKMFGKNSNIQDVGSPPHVRGKGEVEAGKESVDRITPACAGKSRSGQTTPQHQRDHPRVCGEKVGFVFQLACPLGSPPHVRGKGADHLRSEVCLGITPACAGKSSLRWAAIQTHGDHPRVCGEKSAQM